MKSSVGPGQFRPLVPGIACGIKRQRLADVPQLPPPNLLARTAQRVSRVQTAPPFSPGLQAGSAQKQVIQRMDLPPEPKSVDLEKFKMYLRYASQLIERFRGTGDASVLELKPDETGDGVLETVQNKLYDWKDACKGDEAARTLGLLLTAIKNARMDLKKPPTPLVKPTVTTPVVLHPSKESALSELQRCLEMLAGRLMIPVEAIGDIIQGLARNGQVKDSLVRLMSHLLRSISKSLASFDLQSLANRLAGKESLRTQHANLGSIQGIIAELEFAVNIMEEGATEIRFSEKVTRSKFLSDVSETHDVGLRFKKKTGYYHSEVKRDVGTLDKKLTDRFTDRDTSGGFRFAPKQLTSMLILSQENPQITHDVRCNNAIGWVKFIVGRNCESFIQSGFTLYICGAPYPGSLLRLLWDLVIEDLDEFDYQESSKEKWSIKYNDPDSKAFSSSTAPASRRRSIGIIRFSNLSNSIPIQKPTFPGKTYDSNRRRSRPHRRWKRIGRVRGPGLSRFRSAWS
jgi:hypothetical protein